VSVVVAYGVRCGPFQLLGVPAFSEVPCFVVLSFFLVPRLAFLSLLLGAAKSYVVRGTVKQHRLVVVIRCERLDNMEAHVTKRMRQFFVVLQRQ
jgi:hypothetical protein